MRPSSSWPASTFTECDRRPSAIASLTCMAARAGRLTERAMNQAHTVPSTSVITVSAPINHCAVAVVLAKFDWASVVCCSTLCRSLSLWLLTAAAAGSSVSFCLSVACMVWPVSTRSSTSLRVPR